MKMRITCISDTHGLHRKLELPGGDVLVFAGDYTAGENIYDFLNSWMMEQDYKSFVIVRGNHDHDFIGLEESASKFSNVHVLHDSGMYIQGKYFYGTPWTKQFLNWSYMAYEHVLEEIYKLIPDKTEILVTHNPPYGVMDLFGHLHLGSPSLRDKVNSLPELKMHVFGHIHEGAGEAHNFSKGQVFVNASQTDNYNRFVGKVRSYNLE